MGYKNNVSVRVCGKTMTLTGNESVEYMTKVANYIEEKAEEIRRSDSSRTLNPNLISVLTSLNIADDYFKMKEKRDALEQQLAKLKEETQALGSSPEELEQKNKMLSLEEEKLEVENRSLLQQLEEAKAYFGPSARRKDGLAGPVERKNHKIGLLEEDLKDKIAKNQSHQNGGAQADAGQSCAAEEAQRL
mgnify:CR=1 FL=1